MATLLDMARRWQSLPLETMAESAIDEEKEGIIGTLQYQLYEQSLDGDGNPLRSPYSSVRFHGAQNYRQRKEEMRGKEITDLYLTGEFYANMVLSVSSGEYHITSTDQKTEYLVNWAKAPIFGLTIESKESVWNVFLRPLMITRIAEFTGCGVS